MSVTITIHDNDQYSEANELVTYRTFGCQSCEFNGVQPDCRECGGHGNHSYPQFPFELNIANANFATLWSSLGFEPEDFAGEMDPRIIINVLRTADPALAVRGELEERGANGARSFDCGTTLEQVNRYHNELLAIASEAERREQRIVWG